MKFPASFALLSILILPGIVRADLKANDPAPPLAQSQIITVYRGEATPIPLRAQGRLANEARFILRSSPKLGKLGAIEVGQAGSATVIYQHDDSNGTGDDSFTYAAQAPGSPVSAPARVRLQIVERPANFRVPERLEFGSVRVGAVGQSDLEIKNTGGGIVQGEIRVPAPWKIAGSPTYQIGRGETARFRLTFTPNDERDFVGKVTYSHDSQIETLLHAKGFFPFRANPNSVDLQHPARSPERSLVSVSVTNPQSEPLELEVQAPPFVDAPATLTVPADGSSELILRAQSAALTGGQGKVVLSGKNGRAEISVQVFPAPAEIATEPPTTFALGRIAAGEPLKGMFRILNRGGSPAEISIECPPALSLVGPQTRTISPGQKQEIRFVFEPNKSGDYAEPLTLTYQGRTQTLLFSAQIESPSALLPNRPVDYSPESLPAPLPIEPAPTTIPFSFEKLYVISQTYHTVKIAWAKPTVDPPAAYRIDRRKISSDGNGNVNEVWEPLAGVRFGEEFNAATAEISGLYANQKLSIRIFSLDSAGKVTAASSMFAVASKIYVPTKVPGWLWLIPVLAFVIAIFILIRRRQRQIREEDLNRLEQITRI